MSASPAARGFIEKREHEKSSSFSKEEQGMGIEQPKAEAVRYTLGQGSSALALLSFWAR